MTKELEIPKELNEGQALAWKAMEAFVCDLDDNVMFLLEGYAGTGKTFLSTKLISALVTNKIIRSIAMTAPTNKAVKVLRKMSKELKQKGVEFITVHKLLGVKEKINDDGTITFEPDQLAQGGPTISEYDLVVVDEVSMLHDELYNELMKHSGHVKIIFTGDSAQIPPVGLVDSIPLIEEYRTRDKIGRVVLNEIMRQKEGNSIIEIASTIRKNLSESYIELPDTNMLDKNEHGVIYMDMSEQENRDKLTSLLSEYFCSESFKSDADYVKVLAWRNTTVSSFNNIIRSMIYADQMPESGILPRIMLGEKLIANSPIIADYNMIIYSTNEEFEVIDYQIRSRTIATDGEAIRLSYYKIETIGEFNVKKKIDVLHEDSEEAFKRIALDMKANAIKTKGANRAWPKYYQFLRSFADVTYNYAVTCHKCVAGDTEIITPNGIIKIADIQINDMVYAGTKYCKVLNKWKSIKPGLKITTRSGRSIICSDEHQFKQWHISQGFYFVKAETLIPGNRILIPNAIINDDNSYRTPVSYSGYFFDEIKSIEPIEPIEMFDIEVENEHEFVANGFAVHNCQGSTYQNVFIAEDDLNMNRNIRERNRIKYTAFTRASEKLYRIKK